VDTILYQYLSRESKCAGPFVVCTFDQIVWFKFRDDEMVSILSTLAGAIRKANKFLPRKYDVIID
jgi:hypothetical protein